VKWANALASICAAGNRSRPPTVRIDFGRYSRTPFSLALFSNAGERSNERALSRSGGARAGRRRSYGKYLDMREKRAEREREFPADLNLDKLFPLHSRAMCGQQEEDDKKERLFFKRETEKNSIRSHSHARLQ
jgi:hypothetical protein